MNFETCLRTVVHFATTNDANALNSFIEANPNFSTQALDPNGLNLFMRLFRAGEYTAINFLLAQENGHSIQAIDCLYAIAFSQNENLLAQFTAMFDVTAGNTLRFQLYSDERFHTAIEHRQYFQLAKLAAEYGQEDLVFHFIDTLTKDLNLYQSLLNELAKFDHEQIVKRWLDAQDAPAFDLAAVIAAAGEGGHTALVNTLTHRRTATALQEEDDELSRALGIFCQYGSFLAQPSVESVVVAGSGRADPVSATLLEQTRCITPTLTIRRKRDHATAARENAAILAQENRPQPPKIIDDQIVRANPLYSKSY